MKLSSSKIACSARGAFTLVELQIVIAVIALMAAIAIPQVVRISRQAQEAKDRANAQHVCSVAAAAAAAGAVFTDVESAVSQLTSDGGALVATGAFAGSRYRLTSLSATELEAAKRHLQFGGGQLTVIP